MARDDLYTLLNILSSSRPSGRGGDYDNTSSQKLNNINTGTTKKLYLPNNRFNGKKSKPVEGLRYRSTTTLFSMKFQR
jgi:hypothetical protein